MKIGVLLVTAAMAIGSLTGEPVPGPIPEPAPGIELSQKMEAWKEEEKQEEEAREARREELARMPEKDETGDLYLMGLARASEEEMTEYLLSVYPDAPEEVRELPGIYLEEGERLGIRGDIAFAQSLLETGNFQYHGSAVTPDQHNYCGHAVTRNGMKGTSFDTAREGVRAQIQHLYAYATDAPLPEGEEILDTRFELVQRGCAPTLDGLSHHWAAGGEYGDHIKMILERF